MDIIGHKKIDLDFCKADHTEPYHITMMPVTALVEIRYTDMYVYIFKIIDLETNKVLARFNEEDDFINLNVLKPYIGREIVLKRYFIVDADECTSLEIVKLKKIDIDKDGYLYIDYDTRISEWMI